jgi:phosphomannomutase/phosphoglucomutase
MGRSLTKLIVGQTTDSAALADVGLDPESHAPIAPVASSRLHGGVALGGVQRYVFLIGTTLALLAGAFLLWQTWLVFSERRESVVVDDVRDFEVRTLGKVIADARAAVQHAVANDAVTVPLARGDEGRAAAAEALKRMLPDLVSVEFYRADIGDVLASNFAAFGYAKASLLVQAYQMQRMGPAQSAPGADRRRNLVFALPVLRDNEPIAYAYVALPFAPVIAAFRQRELSAARADLRQGDGRGDFVLASIGSAAAGSTLNTPGVSIVDSSLRIGTAPPLQPIFIPRNLAVLIPLLLLILFAGALMLYARRVGWSAALDRILRRNPEVAASEIPVQLQKKDTMSEATANAAKLAATDSHAGPAVAVDRSMFRAYDIRGVLGKTLNAEVAREIGRAIGSEAASRGLTEIAVGRDGRLSGPELSAALIEGLRSTGLDVTDIGAAPTPVLYFATYQLNLGSGVMVTGSHNPPDYNGFKIVLGGETLSEGAIQKLYARIVERDFMHGKGSLHTIDLAGEYIDRISSDILLNRKLKVVIDCGNGIAGAIAPTVLKNIGAEIVPLFCEVDGNFPNHHPDPSDLHNLKDLIMSVKQLKADIGLAFDGDGDRLGVVTASGEVIFPDRLLMLFAKDVLSRNPGASIIYDVKCTGKLQALVLEAGGSPIMWRTGHSLIKAKMRETDAALAGEMSGHFFFKERWFGFDDGIYAAARLLEILAGDPERRAPQAIFDELPNSVSTPELKIEMAEGEHYAFIERFQAIAKFDGARLTTIDGMRADWPDGWGLVRASNTTPVLVLRFDADTKAALTRIQGVFREQLLALDPKLKLPF